MQYNAYSYYRVRGLYDKLWTEFFPPCYTAQVRSARAMKNKDWKKKIHDFPYGPTKRD